MAERTTAYSWYVLIICFLVGLFGGGLPQTILAPLFLEISQKTGLSIPNLMLVWSMVPLGAVVASLPAGILTDRIGFRWAGSIGLLVAAVFGALRGVCFTLPGFLVTVLLFGVGYSIAMVTTPKALGYYFPPRLLGTAVGIFAAGLFIGTGLATTLGATMSGAFGGWENTMYYLGIVTGILAVIWLTTVKVPKLEVPQGMPGPAGPASSEGLRAVFRTRDMWMLAVAYLLSMGSSMAVMGYLPTFFAGVLQARGYVQSAAVATAGMIAGMLSWGMVIGNVLWPATSDRLGLRKVVVAPGMLLTGVFTGLAFFIGPPGIWAVTFVWGLAAGVAPLIMTIPLEHPRIGPALAGGATGLLMLLGQVGGVCRVERGQSAPWGLRAWDAFRLGGDLGSPRRLLPVVCDGNGSQDPSGEARRNSRIERCPI